MTLVTFALFTVWVFVMDNIHLKFDDRKKVFGFHMQVRRVLFWVDVFCLGSTFVADKPKLKYP